MTWEYWLGERKSCGKRDHQVAIAREDLGLLWSVQLKAKTYTEEKIEREPGPDSVDVHKLGFAYDPVYDWQWRESEEKKDIAGFPCRAYILEGDADCSEVVLKFWVGSGEYSRVNSLILDFVGGDEIRKPAGEMLQKFPDGFLVGCEKFEDPPLGYPRTTAVFLKKLEEVEAPDKIYEVPEGMRKIR